MMNNIQDFRVRFIQPTGHSAGGLFFFVGFPQQIGRSCRQSVSPDLNCLCGWLGAFSSEVSEVIALAAHQFGQMRLRDPPRFCPFKQSVNS